MPKNRLDFQTFLEAVKGDDNVYFQPPPSLRMNYPAIVYELYDIENTPADNLAYIQATRYQLTYITKNPDDVMIKTLAKLPLCSFDRFYTAENLNHYTYTIFY